MINSYSTSAVSGGTNVGGLIGKNIDAGIVVHSYWDTMASGQVGSAGGTGLTAVQMRDAETYLNAGWDEWHCREFCVLRAHKLPVGMREIMPSFFRHKGLAPGLRSGIMFSAFLSRYC